MALACNRILRNGLIIQWGYLTISGSPRTASAKNIPLPLAYTDTNYTVLCAPKMWSDGSTFRSAAISARQETSSTISLYFYGVGTSDTLSGGISWLTIGF